MRIEDQRIREYIESFQGTFRVDSGRSKFIELYDPLGFITSYCHTGKGGYDSMKELEEPSTWLGGGFSSSLEDEA